MPGVSDMIGKLDAAAVQAKKEAAERRAREIAEAKAAAEAHAKLEAELKATEVQRKAEAERLERERWKVDEEASGAEAAALKKAFRERVEPKQSAQKVEIKDIPTIVIDLGSSTIKVGYAGQDAPLQVVSAVVGHVRGDHFMDLEKHAHVDKDVYVGDEVWAYRDVLKVTRVIKNGAVQHWNDFELLLKHILHDELKLPEDLHEYPVLLTEPPLNPKANRERLMKCMFETFNFAAVYVANTATLSLYSIGAVTGIVVECGYDVSTSVAVFEGEPIPNSLRRLDVAGRELDNYMIRLLNMRGYRFNELRAIDQFLIRDIKESLCEVASDAAALAEAKAEAPEEEYDTSSNGNDMLPGYEKKAVPDKLSIGTERFDCPEALFNPGPITGKDLLVPGIQMMVMQTVGAVAMDLVKPLYSNVLLSGGTTMLTGFTHRLEEEIKQRVPGTVPVTMVAPPQRHIAVWAGGSVLAMAKHFNFHWVSREEYDEYGCELAHHGGL